MFSGLITAIGRISEIVRDDNSAQLVIEVPHCKGWENCSAIPIGSSIACSGICLTVIEVDTNNFKVDASPETLSVTTLGTWQEGSEVNLERSLALGDELGGHFVMGHVDEIGEVIAITPKGESHCLKIKASSALAQLIAPKGSIAVDGVSLTINQATKTDFEVMIIPHTWKNTTLGSLKEGSKINLEADIVARYVARNLEMK